MRTSRWVVGLVVVGACQAGDDGGGQVDLDVAERLPPPTWSLSNERQIDLPVPGYRRGRPVDSRVMWNGTIRNLFAWRQERPSEDGPISDIWGITYTSKGSGPGTLKTPYGFPLSREAGPYRGLDVRLDPVPSQFFERALAEWRSDDLAYTARIGLKARSVYALDTAPAPVPERTDEAYADHDGHALRVWIDDTTGAVVAQREVGAPLVVADGAGAKSDVDVAWGFDSWVVTWRNADDVHLTRIDPVTGGPVDTHVEGAVVVGGVAITGAGVQARPRVACATHRTNGFVHQCFVVYEDDRNAATTGLDVYVTRFRIEPTLVLPGTEAAIVTAAGDDTLPDVEHASEKWLITWSTTAPDLGHLFLAAVGEDATPIGGVRQLDAPQPRNDQRDPAVAASPDGELFVWSDDRVPGSDIVGVRVDPTGEALDPTAFTIAGAAGEQATPAAAFDGADYVVAWTDLGTGDGKVRVAAVGLDGSVAPAGGIGVSASAGFQGRPAVAADGTGASLVVWEDRRDLATTGVDLYGAVIAGGAVTVAAFPICTAAGDQRRPSVAYDAAQAQFVVAWSDGRGADLDIYAGRVIGGAAVDGDGVAITTGAGDQLRPDVAARGGVPFVAWEDHRAAASQVFGTRLATAGGIAAVTPNGAVLGGGGATQPQVAAVEHDAMLVAWIEPRTIDAVVGRGVADDGVLGPLLDLAIDAGGVALPGESAVPFRMSFGYPRERRFRESRVLTRVDRMYRRAVKLQRVLGDACGNAEHCSSGFCVDAVCCDAACGGTSNFDCQACSVVKGSSADGSCEIVTDLRVCRRNADPFCDTRELCDGSAGAECPADVGQHGGDACTAACGAGVCPPADETGAPHACDCP
jgi:hypothetical protein